MAAQLLNFPVAVVQAPVIKKKKTAGYTAEFNEAVWGPYPRKLNCSKLLAFKAWQRLDEDERKHVLSVIPIFARQCSGKDEQYIPHLATWLNQRRFETVAMPAPVPSVSQKVRDWETILKIYNAIGRWSPTYGPEPGRAGYQGPECKPVVK